MNNKEDKQENKNKCDNDDTCDCGCNEGKECTCDHNHKHSHNHDLHGKDGHCDCGCEDEQCNCNEHCDCGCQDGEQCTCEHDHCDCGCSDHMEGNEEFKKYEKAFIQLENALIKADQDLENAKKKAAENEHLAVGLKKDFERYKARVKEEEDNMKQNAIINIADKLIPILDNFEQALKVKADENTIKGFAMIEAMLKSAVKNLGIEEIDSSDGTEFDPKLHNAVSKTKTKDKNLDGKIAKTFQKGYKIDGENGKIVRTSVVEVFVNE